MNFFHVRQVSSEYSPNKPNFTETFRLLCTGMNYVNKYFSRLEQGSMIQHDYREDHYIRRRLMPSADNAKHSFDAMIESSEEQLKRINNSLEKSVLDKKKLIDDIKGFNAEESKITIELKGKSAAVSNAQKQLDQKKIQLDCATNTLRTAENKLQEARDSQDTAMNVAIGLSFIPFIGLLAAPITLIVALTALQKGIDEACHHKNTAAQEVSSSKTALEEAVSSEDKVRNELSILNSRKTKTEQMLTKLKESINQLQKDQAKIIEVNENIKKCYMALCKFNGSFKVLWSETRGGYSLSLLRDVSNPVCTSVRSLLQCSSLNALCDDSILRDLNFRLKQIEQATITANRNASEDEDILDLI